MSRNLPPKPNLEHLRKQAKRLLNGCLAGDAEALTSLVRRRRDAPPPKLSDAQHAREYGFPTWVVLKQTVGALAGGDPAAALEAAVRLDEAQGVRDVLARFPSLRSHLDDAMPHDAFGATPLIVAANRKNPAMVDALLEAGANIN